MKLPRSLSTGVRLPGMPLATTSTTTTTSGTEKTKLVVVLDIDETLIHSNPGLPPCEDSFALEIDGWKTRVKRRPHVRWFLETAATKFELATFTAGTQEYASKILEDLDPNGELITHRFYRHHCLRIDDETYLKDLDMLGRPMERLVLVDNNLLSFIISPSQGIPIKSYYGRDASDNALLALMTILDALSEEPDVRPILERAYGLPTKLAPEREALQAVIAHKKRQSKL